MKARFRGGTLENSFAVIIDVELLEEDKITAAIYDLAGVALGLDSSPETRAVAAIVGRAVLSLKELSELDLPEPKSAPELP